jgi:hypothetical protein
VPLPLFECEEIAYGYYTCKSTWPEVHLCYLCEKDESRAERKSAEYDYCFSEP